MLSSPSDRQLGRTRSLEFACTDLAVVEIPADLATQSPLRRPRPRLVIHQQAREAGSDSPRRTETGLRLANIVQRRGNHNLGPERLNGASAVDGVSPVNRRHRAIEVRFGR